MDVVKAVAQLGDRIKGYFTSYGIDQKKYAEKADAGRTAVLSELKLFREKFEGSDQKDIIQAIDILKKTVEDLDLTVNVEAPVVNVPEPRVEVVKESENMEELLTQIVVGIKEQMATQQPVMVMNQNPSEAISVRLTDADGKRFYNAMLNAVSAGGGLSANDSTTLNEIKLATSGSYIINIQPHSSNANIKYFGFALPGTATSAAGWKIIEKNTTTGKTYLRANGTNAFTNTFDDRETYSYS